MTLPSPEQWSNAGARPGPDQISSGETPRSLLGFAFAHSRPGEAEETWEPLAVHLEEVATRTSAFAAAFGSAEWGWLAGLWHDLGKYRPEFQRRLRGSREQAPHAAVGAALAASKNGLGPALAFAIAGHHTGLANREAQGETDRRSLRERLMDGAADLDAARDLIPAEVLAQPLPAPPSLLRFDMPSGRSEQEALRRRTELWIRFLFSALIDADRLATEAFYEPGKRDMVGATAAIATLRERLDRTLAGFRADSQVNRVRSEVLEACRAAADRPPGIFRLTVPTGGGKTLSSMAFALRHAEHHGLRRVIVGIPYTSIIEQNAAVYREVLGSENVVEHHSNLDEAARLEAAEEAEVRRRLAAENWDSPVVVTTNVQLFESLLSDHPSRCRKLHNMARSVVVLDEAQSLPADYLTPLLEVLRELVDGYGCTLLLMTATQPALQRRDTLPAGFETASEIIEPNTLARALDRVRISWPDPDAEPASPAALAAELAGHKQVLAIVHRRRDARELVERLPPRHRYHLSALMCPAHRTKRIKEVKARLRAGKPCRVVSTQLVEAGVDISFPVVYRALAGLDSLAQAAGRCNREGEVRDMNGNPAKGEFVVFRAATRPPPGILRVGLETTESLLRQYGGSLALTDAAIMETYFRMLYGKCATDRKGVQADRALLNFATVARKVRLIDDDYSRPVVVPWGDATDRIREFEQYPSQEAQRGLQPFLVQIPHREVAELEAQSAVVYLHDRVHVLAPHFAHLYDAEWGLMTDAEARADPETLVC